MGHVNGTTGPISDDTIVVPRPHFELVGNELYFLISKRPLLCLPGPDVSIWQTLVREPSLGELRSRFAERAEPTVRYFAQRGLCELVSPHARPGRRRVLVFEPHSDDAALSVGGTMWLRRHECQFILATAGSRSNFTSYYHLDRQFFDADVVSALRNDEARLFMRLLGGQHVALGLSEGPLRYHDGNWSLDWFRQHRSSVSAFNLHRCSDEELSAWTTAIGSVLREISADEVWLPLGIGAHTDHELTRNACLSVLINDAASARGRTIRLYQDVPYDTQSPAHVAAVVSGLHEKGASLVREVMPIQTAFREKLHLLSVYASQFKLAAVQAGVEASARTAAVDTGLAEVLWRVERLPASLDTTSLYIDQNLVSCTAANLKAWARRHRDAERIRILLLMPAGCWARDMTFLLRAFPRARFEVYAAPGSAAEAADFCSARIHVFNVARGSRAWAQLALRLAIRRPAPTVFLAGPERLREAQKLAWLWPLSQPVIVPTLDHFVLALRQALAEVDLAESTGLGTN